MQSLKSAPKALHKEARLKNELIFLIYHMAMQSRKTIPIDFWGQFATLWAYVAIIKYCCVDEIHNVMKVNPKPNFISYLFIVLSSCSAFVLVYERWRGFLLFLLGISIYETSKVFLFCQAEISQITTLHVAFLLSLESSMNRCASTWFETVWSYGVKAIDYWTIFSIKIK